MTLGPDGKVQILFVCTGNLCRSPMAAAMLKQKLKGQLKKRLRIVSAGTHALEGLPSPLRAQSAAAIFNVDLSRHLSQPVTAWMLAHSDVILAMDYTQVEAIGRLDPTAASRTFLLKEFGLPPNHPGGILSIRDPISGDERIYRRVYQEIDEETSRILPILDEVVQSVG